MLAGSRPRVESVIRAETTIRREDVIDKATLRPFLAVRICCFVLRAFKLRCKGFSTQRLKSSWCRAAILANSINHTSIGALEKWPGGRLESSLKDFTHRLSDGGLRGFKQGRGVTPAASRVALRPGKRKRKRLLLLAQKFTARFMV